MYLTNVGPSYLFVVLMLLIFYTFPASSQKNAVDYVDVFIGTAGDHGQLDPSASIPFGMVKIGPDTEPSNHSGYDFNATKIKGFSHNRIGGVGCSGAGGNLRILPYLGDQGLQHSTFNKANEKASPAYYSVVFDNQIKAELTANQHIGLHRYTFPRSNIASVQIDLGSSFANLISTDATFLNDQEFTARISAQNVCNIGRYTVYYHFFIHKAPKERRMEGNQITLVFPTQKNEQIIIEVTASSISEGDAKREWELQRDQLVFEEVVKSGKKNWDDLLNRIEVEGKEEYKTLFYSHLYHMFLNPVKSENSMNQFKATNGKVYQATDYVKYDGWSMWDNFRNKFSLYALITPEVSTDIGRSLVDLFRYGKPTWSGYAEPVPTVRTEHSIVTLLDLYQRGIDQFDIETVYHRMLPEIENTPAKSPDEHLEKSYDLWALSEIASILEKTDDQKFLLAESMKYKGTWQKYFLKMGDNADIMHAEGLYEGTLWQYRWHVQYDISGLISLIGGKDAFTEQLTYFFDNDLYNHGNQPDIHVPFMFNYSNKPWLTQKWVNKILTKEVVQYYGTHGKWETPYVGRIYKAKPEGYIPEMDDDEGTMSGWYVLSAMGLYPVEVGKPEFQLSAPIFDRIVIHLPENKTFEIVVENLSDESFYIDTVTLNGEKYNKTSLKHSAMSGGGKLIYNLSKTPNQSWGLE